jgi:transcriptional regulator with XRE-family HTH domain
MYPQRAVVHNICTVCAHRYFCIQSEEMICNKDCEHCPYPDCINDEMDWDDYEASEERDKLLKVKDSAPTKTQKESYYKRNREACLARCKEHYKNHSEQYREYRKKYYAENRERILLRQRIYDHMRRKKKCSGKDPKYQVYNTSYKSIWRAPGIDFLRCITYARIKRGLSQKALAELIGVTYLTVSNWERGAFGIAHMDKLIAAMPELKDMIGTKCEDFCDRSAICDRQDCYYSHIKPRAKKENPPADVEDRQAEGVSAHLPHDNK